MGEPSARYRDALLLKALADAGVKPLVHTFALIRILEGLGNDWDGLDNFWAECGTHMSRENLRVLKRNLRKHLETIGPIDVPNPGKLLLELEQAIVGDLREKYAPGR